jgi:hypothetical protein
MGETRVDLLHLLEDLRDAYPGSLEETILTEILANALDSGADRVQLTADPVQAALTVVDNGSGMQRRELVCYHDIAATTKTRGHGIGFAGVGIKLGLLVSEEVFTETRRGKTNVATSWHLASRHRAPWKWCPAPGLVAERGTAVRLKLENALSPLLDPGFIEGAVRRHFPTLLDPTFDPILAEHYPKGLAIEINGRPLEKQHWTAPAREPVEVRMLRKRKPSAAGYLIRDALPLPEEQRGVAISTFGKVIKRGWDWLGLTPAAPDRIGGLIEAPALAACLTLSKGDFIRVGPRGATFLAYRKAIQQAVSRQLSIWGDAAESKDHMLRRVVRPLERDLERVLEDLADDFPLLASLIERKRGGQKRLPMGQVTGGGNTQAFVAATFLTSSEERGAIPPADTPAFEQSEAASSDSEDGRKSETSQPTQLPGRSGPKRPAHYGLTIQLEERVDDQELGRLIESTIWVNRAHPAYRRAEASRSTGYHISLAVALALAPLAVEPADEHGFVTAFLSRWGEALERSKARRR